MRADKNLLGIVLVTLSLLGCNTLAIKSKAPNGFAVYSSDKKFRAVSPEGVVYRVREIENKPAADLLFWKTALKTYMLDSGYHFIDESDIDRDNNKGYLLELAAPVKDKDYGYLIALYRVGDKLVIIESAGEISLLRSYRNNIIETMSTMFI